VRSVADRLLGPALGAVAGLLLRDLVTDSFASLWLPAALLGALLWTTRPLKSLLLAIAGGLVVLWLGAAFGPLTGWMVRGLVRRDPIAPGDAVVVLSSRLQHDGQPTSAALSRLVQGLSLLRAGQAPRLVVTELTPPSASSAELARGLMRDLGLSYEIAAVGPVGRTRDEAALVGALYRREGWHRLLLVTSPLHSRRACAAFERQAVAVVCCPALETEFDAETLDRPTERLAAFRSALHEWLGLWLYRQRAWA
jgi:uncharacterized SAM-binding protein YcdF (DUF218 family)